MKGRKTKEQLDLVREMITHSIENDTRTECPKSKGTKCHIESWK